ncbi:hypothetical protein MNBD_GAMMA16-1737 [hydrothermal vent metagenome]|uniref:AsmA domain-containing protein n=1 Tax=hydrothermal vent metagenome TaxID=652676 RepID=A0A3B1A0H5_9ZZZZ
MKKLFKVIAITFASLISLVLIAGLLLTVFFDPNDYKNDIRTIVKQEAGRELVIHGDLSLSRMKVWRK